MTPSTRFTVCFSDGERETVPKFKYKTFGGARRFITDNLWMHKTYRNVKEWAIERIDESEWAQTCVIAQSKGWVHKPRFRNRSEADKWVKGQAE